ncbi:hypothetical protein M0G43_04730 [Subsaxibacter sp. CAU 1640]|uniref:hypothetical protein n=1 Tax=Subsaxibacter sp. CAU 1640 TaxID=2933271 RepID=UPI002005FECA|nr:hypothetical protein [Subsaxibacter sp. CAU 1640]MCK7589870.1 hypothetical protein [Subsaxibacter sp. CAU 1640]
MKFSITRLRAAFGDIRAMEKLHVDTHTEGIINDIENEPFAISASNVMYADLGELAGYHLLNTVIVGSFHIKTIKGVQLKVKGSDFELNLNSDMVEIESDFSNVSNRSITRIDFEIEKEDLSKISKSKIISLELIAKKQHIVFSIAEKNN